MEIDYPNLVWEMWATSPEGEKVYCGCADKAEAANAFGEAIKERGFTDFKKNQTDRGNAGQTLMKRMN